MSATTIRKVDHGFDTNINIATDVITSTAPFQNSVQVHALSAGHLTLPEKHFVHPASDSGRRTVPSLSFLIQHHDAASGKLTRFVFDLGLRRDIARYTEPIRRHATTRQPLTTQPDVVKSLAAGGLEPADIDYVIYSHMHWDHIGEPLDFPSSTFVVGSGTTDLLEGKPNSLLGGHSFFERDLLPADRKIELCKSSRNDTFDGQGKPLSSLSPPSDADVGQSWTNMSEFRDLRVIDVFHDGTVYIVDAPGHLPGHINLLLRTGSLSPSTRSSPKWVYLGGDACHDRRIIRGERAIGEWLDDQGYICCIHADRQIAEKTIHRIKMLEESGVEVIFAHDVEWEQDVQNTRRFFGPSLHGT